MKILNIDGFAEVKRQIIFKGTTHAIEELTVQQFIENLSAAEALEKTGATEQSMSQSFEGAVAAIRQAIPTIPEVDVRGMKMAAMSAVMQFIRGESDPEGVVETDGTAKKPD